MFDNNAPNVDVVVPFKRQLCKVLLALAYSLSQSYVSVILKISTKRENMFS